MEESVARTDNVRGEFMPEALEAINNWLNYLPSRNGAGAGQM